MPDRGHRGPERPGVRRRVADRPDPDLWPRITLAHVPHPEWAGPRAAPRRCRRGRPGCRRPTSAWSTARGHRTDRDRGHSSTPARRPTSPCAALLVHPAHMGGSDGIYVGGHPHPRGWGAFARLPPPARPRTRRLDVGAGGGASRRPSGAAVRTHRPRPHPARPGRRPRHGRPAHGSPTGRTTPPAEARPWGWTTSSSTGCRCCATAN